jgi:hypothetical protein
MTMTFVWLRHEIHCRIPFLDDWFAWPENVDDLIALFKTMKGDEHYVDIIMMKQQEEESSSLITTTTTTTTDETNNKNRPGPDCWRRLLAHYCVVGRLVGPICPASRHGGPLSGTTGDGGRLLVENIIVIVILLY